MSIATLLVLLLLLLLLLLLFSGLAGNEGMKAKMDTTDIMGYIGFRVSP